MRQHTSAYVSIRQHTPAYASIRQHTPAYVNVRRVVLLLITNSLTLKEINLLISSLNQRCWFLISAVGSPPQIKMPAEAMR
jgi:hypothetical protein